MASMGVWSFLRDGCWFFSLAWIWRAGVPGGLTKKVKKFPDPLIFAWMRASDSSVGGNPDRVAKLEVGNRALITAEGRLSP